MADQSFSDFLSTTGKAIADRTGLSKLSAGISRLGFYKKGTGETPPPNYYGSYFSGETEIRAYIKVPTSIQQQALNNRLGSQFLVSASGILFPYTPTITQDYTAQYQTLNPVHSNYALHFYKHSQAGPIQVSGKFTVQNHTDATRWISSTHLLRFLTKMRFGDDAAGTAGAPPPICRFYAYGEYQYQNVPVVVSSFRVELPDGVDYYSTVQNSFGPKNVAVPVESTISVTLLPMYSRAELTGLKPDDYLASGADNLRTKGFL